MNNNTVPEARVNKHGVSVIKHVRAEPKTTAGKSKMPAPKLGGFTAGSKPKAVRAPSAETLIKRLNERDQELFGAPAGRVSTYGYESPHIDKFPAQLRQDIADFISTADKRDIRVMKDMISHYYEQPNKFALTIKALPFARTVNSNNADSYGDTAPDDISSIYSSLNLRDMKKEVTDYHLGVVKTEHLAKSLGIRMSGFSVPHEYYQQAEVLRSNMDIIEPAVPMIMALPERHSYEGMSTERVLEVANFAQRYPEHVDLITAAIKERRGFDAEALEAMMESGSVSLSEGFL